MAKIARVAQKQFGSTGSGGDFGKFGSKFAGSAVYTQDPATIQALSNFTDGWASAVVSGSVPELEDMNSLFLLIFYQLAYLFQAGIAEWDPATTYYIGSMVNVSGAVYISKTDTNLNNTPASSPTNWQLSAGEQPGFVKDFAGPAANIPVGYLSCDGSAVSRTTYANLFAAIGTYWGAGDASTTFNLPDLRLRTTVGIDSRDTDVNTVGKTLGEKTHQLTVPEMPSHTHSGAFNPGYFGAGAGGGNYVGTNNSTGSTGGDGAHNNMQPSAVMLKIIKY